MEKGKNPREKVRAALLPRGPMALAEPEKELRFTRAAQAPIFFAAAVLLFAASMAVFILSTQDWGMAGPMLDGWLWLCLPGGLLCYAMLRLGLRCTRHAYIILNPLGIEIFPFFKARQNLQVIYWSQVAEAEVKAGSLVIHFSEEKTSGVMATLKPIPRRRRPLLESAVEGVMKKRRN
ncbi:MAG: hypothetical protein KJO21_13615 [Verrucomicrobiae bacterium]|nr:hypothetical protein [Verrucomicrobiae bacterium]NNJ44356.1 hypothetical protein [Akkermansiaceae bacterium]